MLDLDVLVAAEIGLAQVGSAANRDFVESVPGWYIGPVLPSFALVWGGTFAGGSVVAAVAGSFITIATVAWIVANLRAAAELIGARGEHSCQLMSHRLK